MIIVNADDYGRCQAETDAVLACYREGRLTSTSAMVFMEDSERAAELARGCDIDVGLHLNLSQLYNGRAIPATVAEAQARIVRFMKSSKYAVLLYHPGLRKDFREVFRAQHDEFVRLYGRPPTHVDGHQHRHLCANLLFDPVIPSGQRVRRNFSFFPGEKGWINRTYRRWVDRRLQRRYRLTDYFFSLPQCLERGKWPLVAGLARASKVEVMTHPVRPDEFDALMGESFLEMLRGLEVASYVMV